MRVVMVRSNPVDPDVRITKEAESLARAGYDVTILGWDRYLKNQSPVEHKSNYTINRIRLKAPFGIKVLFYLPIWWLFESIWLFKEKWDIVHAADFDTFLPALIVAKVKGKPIVYDIFDFYADMIPLPRLLRWSVATIDRFLMHFANAVILVDKSILKQIGGSINDRILIVTNTPKEILTNAKLKSKLKDEKNKFTIFFLGALYESRYANLDKIIDAVKDMKDVELIIAGFGEPSYINQIKEKIATIENIRYIGKISDDDAIENTLNADLLFALYDPFRPNNKYLSPNKLFEAMMYAKPIIVSENSTMEEIVIENNYGIAANCRNVESIKSAIITLKNNPELCKQLGINGRKAYEKKYSWEIMETRILSLYKDLTSCGYLHNVN